MTRLVSNINSIKVHQDIKDFERSLHSPLFIVSPLIIIFTLIIVHFFWRCPFHIALQKWTDLGNLLLTKSSHSFYPLHPNFHFSLFFRCPRYATLITAWFCHVENSNYHLEEHPLLLPLSMLLTCYLSIFSWKTTSHEFPAGFHHGSELLCTIWVQSDYNKSIQFFK